jgi:hypothetical protein
LTLSIFANNTALSWPLADGSLIVDANISSGTIYFNEINGSNGFYSVRFFPDRTGFWRIIITNAGLNTERILEFDIIPANSLKSTVSGGLTASFVR